MACVNGHMGVGRRTEDEESLGDTGGCASQGWLPVYCNAAVQSGLLGAESIFLAHNTLLQNQPSFPRGRGVGWAEGYRRHRGCLSANFPSKDV